MLHFVGIFWYEQTFCKTKCKGSIVKEAKTIMFAVKFDIGKSKKERSSKRKGREVGGEEPWAQGWRVI